MVRLSLVILSTTLMVAPLAAKPSPFGALDTAKAPGAAMVAEPPVDTIDAGNPEAVAEFLRKAGYRAVVEPDDEGDPSIVSGASGVDFLIFFHGCEGAFACTSMEFSSVFDAETPHTADQMNAWNVQRRYGKAMLTDERDPWIVMDINVEGGGLAPAQMAAYLQIWDDLLGDFLDHIDW